MKQPFLLTSIILLIVGLILASFCYTLFTAHADTNDTTRQLSVTGLVNHPSNFSLADLEAMPQTTVTAELYCVDYPNTVAAQGNWTGVKLSVLLDEAGGIQPGAIKVAFYASDGYTTDLTIDAAESDNVILAYAKDGAPLGEVLRLVVPGHWGYKWIAEVVTVQLVNYNFTGKWESVGYSDDGMITQSSQPQTSYSSQFEQPKQTRLPTLPPASPEESTPTSPSPSAAPASNSPSQSPSTQSSNSASQDSNLIEAAVIILVVIVAIGVVALTRRKYGNDRKTI
jgi:hypothetical protein